MKHEEGRRATEKWMFLHRVCGKAPRKLSGRADVVFPNSSIFIGSENSPNLTKRKNEMKSHKGNSILLLFIPAFFFYFFFCLFVCFTQPTQGCSAPLAITRGTRNSLSSTREEQGAQETGCAQGCEQSWALRKGSALRPLRHCRAVSMDWGFWKPLCWWGCKHTVQSASFPSTLDSDVPLSRFKEGSAHSQPCRPDRALPPLQQNSSAHVCVLLLLQLATKES